MVHCYGSLSKLIYPPKYISKVRYRDPMHQRLRNTTRAKSCCRVACSSASHLSCCQCPSKRQREETATCSHISTSDLSRIHILCPFPPPLPWPWTLCHRPILLLPRASSKAYCLTFWKHSSDHVCHAPALKCSSDPHFSKGMCSSSVCPDLLHIGTQ